MSVELPPLPEPTRCNAADYCMAQHLNGAFTAEQLRTYASIAVDAALERAARLLIVAASEVWADGAPAHETGRITQLAGAVRAMKAKP